MDKFAYWALTGLSYIFLVMAGIILFACLCDELMGGESLFNFILYFSGILTFLFFSATSHVLARLIERIYETRQKEDEDY